VGEGGGGERLSRGGGREGRSRSITQVASRVAGG